MNSDDNEIRNVAESYGAQTIGRPDIYAHDKILQEVDLLLKWTVEAYEQEHPEHTVDIVVLLYPTAPLRNISAIDKAIELVRDQGYDSKKFHYIMMTPTSGKSAKTGQPLVP